MGIVGLIIFILFVTVITVLGIAKEAVIVVLGLWIPFALFMVVSDRLVEDDSLSPYTVLRKTLGKTAARIVLVCLLLLLAVFYVGTIYQQYS